MAELEAGSGIKERDNLANLWICARYKSNAGRPI